MSKKKRLLREKKRNEEKFIRCGGCGAKLPRPTWRKTFKCPDCGAKITLI